MKGQSTTNMVKIALLAAIYCAITFAMFFISFGPIQFRVSEMLTVLPAYTKLAIPGLTLGCALANLIGFFAGVNPIGIIDAVVGSAATLIAAILSHYLGKLNNNCIKYFLVPLPPVLINAVIVGLEITFVFSGGFSVSAFTANFISIFIGQATICYLLGVPFMYILSKNDFYKKIF